MSFYDGQLKLQICDIFTVLISYKVLNPFKMADSSFGLHQNFPILMVQKVFFPNSTSPWPQLLKGREIPATSAI